MHTVYNPFTGQIDYCGDSLTFNPVNYVGSDCTGNDGDTNRTLSGAPDLIFLDNKILHPTSDYTITDEVITFNVNVWNNQNITLVTAEPIATNGTYTGNDCSGSDGEINRTLGVAGITSNCFIAVDNNILHPSIDFSIESEIITFKKNVWNNQKISLWRW